MATTVYRSLTAAIAAVSFVLLTACGGGDETSEAQAAAITKALTGQVVVNPEALDLSQAKKRPLAAAPVTGFKAIITAKSLEEAAPKKQATALSSVPTGITPDELGDWAERLYPQYFPSHQTTRFITDKFDGAEKPLVTYAYRMYPETGNCFGVRTDGKDIGAIYLCGPYVGNLIVRYAHVDDRLIKCLVNVEVLGCRPRVTSVLPIDGATNVATQNVAIVANFDQRLLCPSSPISGSFGAITGTLTCTNAATTASVTIMAATLPDSSQITASLSGFLSEDAIPMVAQTWSFATEKKQVPVVTTVTKLVVANLDSAYAGKTGEAVSILDFNTKIVSRLKPQAPGYLQPSYVSVDSTRGVAYVGALDTWVLYRVDMTSGMLLTPFFLDPEHYDNEHSHSIHGVANSDKAVCLATGKWGDNSAYYWANRFVCLDPITGQKVFLSPANFLGGSSMTPTQVLYSAAHKKFYVLSAPTAGMFLEGDGNGSGRDGYKPGTIGLVTEIDAVTYTKGRTWSVGSMPLGVAIDGNTLRVVNTGDKSLSKIDLSTGVASVVTVDWTSTFTGLANPTGILIDSEKGVYYVPDWVDSVRVMSLTTDQQVGRIVTGDVPWGMALAKGSLWVAAPKKAIWAPSGDSVFEIDRTTRTVKNAIPTGSMPWALAVYEVTQ